MIAWGVQLEYLILFFLFFMYMSVGLCCLCCDCAGQPSSSSGFVDFVSALHAKRGDRDPLLVHCSAGVGRTGMFITMETALCMMDANEPVFPLELVQKIRDQRPMVIQTAVSLLTCKMVNESIRTSFIL